VPADLLSLEAAQARLLAHPPLPSETVPLLAAAGRVLAGDLVARLSQPPADMSAMDGYALRFADLPGPLRLVGTAAAGRPLETAIAPGEAARIFTGAPVPQGADTVAVQEEMLAADGRVRLQGAGPAGPGAHIRRAGEDFMAGSPVARAGERVTPARLGLLAAAGHAHVPVHRRPRLTLVATGSELVPPGESPGPAQIIAGNGVMLAALLASAGAEVADAGIIPDDRAAIQAAIAAAAGQSDVVVTIGGASVGDHDLVRPALADLGARLDFWRIAIRPGKPLLAGALGNVLVVGLPGNPVSAYVCALLLLLPLVRHLAGDPAPLPSALTARTRVPLAANGARRDFQRAQLFAGADGVSEVEPFDVQDSAMLVRLAAADALLVRPEHAPAVPAGASVPVLPLG
jgi:molybdopterin molybdotransferase